MRPTSGLTLLLLLLASCSFLNEPAGGEGQLSVQVAAPNLILTNSGGRPIHYLVFEADFAARALWGPCTNPDQQECPPLGSGQKRVIPMSEVYGYEPGKEQHVIVYSWHLVPEGQGRWRVDSLQSTTIMVP